MFVIELKTRNLQGLKQLGMASISSALNSELLIILRNLPSEQVTLNHSFNNQSFINKIKENILR